MRLPIRLRLTLVFTLSMAVLLTVTAGFVYLRLGAELLRTTDTALLTQAEAVAAGIGQPGQGDAFSAASARGLETVTQVLGPGGSVQEWSPGLATRPAVPASVLRGIRRTAYLDASVRGIEGPARVIVLPQGNGTHGGWVLVAASLESRNEALSALLVLLLIGGPVTLALAGAAGWLVAGAALRPVERMRQEADAIAVSDRGRRLPIPASRDEIARLGNTLNAMIGRLEAAFDRERRFVADASHELRTPLAILKAELDLARSRQRTKPELLAAVRSASEEADRLIELAETLLVYSRVEGDRMPLRRQPTELDRLLHEACSSLTGRADAAGVAVLRRPARRHRRGRSGPDPAGRREPGEQRAGAHPQRRPGACQRHTGGRHRPAGRPRHRSGLRSQGLAPRLRAVRHRSRAAGRKRPGSRARPGHRAGDRPGARRAGQRGQPARRRREGHRLPARG